jgi:subtilisin family serine protease
MKKSNLTLIISFVFLHFHCMLSGQDAYSLLAHIYPPNAFLSNIVENPHLQEIFNSYGVMEYKDAFPGTHSTYLQGSKYIRIGDPTRAMALKQELDQTQIFDLVELEEVAIMPENALVVAECNDPVPITDPSTQNQTYLDLMEFPCAWEITQGDPSISVGICDVSLNYNHPDLIGKILDIQCITCDPGLADICDHGFGTAGAIAAVHNTECVAGAGSNTTVKAYLWLAVDCSGPPVDPCQCHAPTIVAVWAAFNAGNRVILAETPRLGGGNQTRLALEDMASRGTTIVLPSLIYPDNPNGHSNLMTIDGVIVVGPLDDNFNTFPYNEPNIDMEIGVPARHVNNSEDMWRLDSPDDGDGLLCKESVGGGTSIGSPHVAATIALMISVNPCLSPAEIENILKSTAKPANALNGAGSLNAYQAVLAAQNAVPQSLVVAAGQTVTISNQTVSYSEITIESQGTLVINNQSVVQMHKLGFITVKRGAKLILDNSTLTTSCPKDYWGGIRVWGNNTMPQPVVYDANDNPLLQYPLSADQAGVVFLLNNSRVERSRNAISTYALGVDYPTEISLRGGLVFAKNTEFVDNRRAAEFMQYPVPNAGYTFTNTSKFIECLFTESSGEVDGSIGVTIWDTDNITFERCNFEGLDREGVVTYDAGAIIKDGNNFINNWRAITNTATYPFGVYPLVVGDKTNSLTRNYFESQQRDFIHSYASNRWAGVDIYNNDFFGNGAGSVGIWMDGPAQFKIDNNSFSDMSGAALIANTGYKNDSKQNFFRCNAVQNAAWGIDFWGDNRHVQFLSNQFQDINTDISLRGEASNKCRIRSNQGGSGSPAGNCFDNSLDEDIVTESLATTESFRYWHSGLTAMPCEIPVTPGNYVTQSTEGSFINCGKLSGFTDTPTEEDLGDIRQQVASLQGQLQQDPDNQSLIAQWLDALYQKETILGWLIRDKTWAGDYSGAEALLVQEGTLESNYSLLGMKMSRGAFTEAQNLLSTLPQTTQDETWFVQTQEINLERLRNEGTFQLSAQQEALLDEVAESNSPIRGHARAILMLLKDKRYELDHPLIERSARQPQAGQENKASAEWVIAPNPANGSVHIDFGKETAEDAILMLFDVHGRLILKMDIASMASTTVDTKALPEGIYMAVLREHGRPAGQSRIAIQH